MAPTAFFIQDADPLLIGVAPIVSVGSFVQYPDTEGVTQRWQVTAVDWYRSAIGAWTQLLRVAAVGAPQAVPGAGV